MIMESSARRALALLGAVLTAASTPSCATLGLKPHAAGDAGVYFEPPSVLPGSGGLVWLPVQLVLSTATKGTGLGEAVEHLQLFSAAIVVRDNRSKKETVVPFAAGTAGGGRGVTLSPTQNQQALFAPLFFALPEGEFTIEAIRLNVLDAARNPQKLDLPLANPFQAAGKPALQLQVRRGKVAAVARLRVTVSFALKEGVLTAVGETIPIDRDLVPVDVVLAQLGWKVSQAPLIYAASPDLPRARVTLLDEKGESQPPEAPVARLGLLLDAPCDLAAVLKLVWRRSGDDREYASLVRLTRTDAVSKCEDKRTLPVSQLVPPGEWILRSTHLLPDDAPRSELSAVKDDAPAVKYFGLQAPTPAVADAALERDIQRSLSVKLGRVQGDGTSERPLMRLPEVARAPQSHLLFLGHFQIAKAPAARPGAPAQDIWDTLLLRTFTLAEVKRSFPGAELFNAYTLEALARDRPKGTLTANLKTSTTPGDAKRVEPVSAEFRRGITDELAACLTEREEADPLVGVAGQLTFNVLKGNTGIGVKSLSVAGESASSQWVRDCFRKKLLAFRFARPVPGNLQGEYRFESN